MQKILTWLILKLQAMAYKPLRVDGLNKKMVEPVHGLVVSYHGETRQLYRFVNEADIPSGRLVMMKQFEQERLMSVSREMLAQYIGAFKEALNGNDTSKLGALIYTLEDTNNNVGPLEAMYNLATVMYFDEEEDVSQWDGDWNAAKKEAFKTMRDQRFFLLTLLKHLHISSSSSTADIVNSLLRDRVKLTAYERTVLDSRGFSAGATTKKRSTSSAKESQAK